EKVTFTKTKKGWQTHFDANRLKGVKLARDLVDAKTGKVMAEAGTKMTPRLARKLQEQGLKEQLATVEDLVGRYVALDLINESTGEIYAEAGSELTESSVKVLDEAGVGTIPTLAIDHINVG